MGDHFKKLNSHSLYFEKQNAHKSVHYVYLFINLFFVGNLQFQQTVRFEAKKGAPIMKIYIYIYEHPLCITPRPQALSPNFPFLSFPMAFYLHLHRFQYQNSYILNLSILHKMTQFYFANHKRKPPKKKKKKKPMLKKNSSLFMH